MQYSRLKQARNSVAGLYFRLKKAGFYARVDKLSIILGASATLLACAQVDEYILGKDNTLKPAPLESIQPKVNIVENWSVPAGKPNKEADYLKLQPIIQGSSLYTADANGLVQAINKKTATLLWKKQLKQRIISGPTVGNGYMVLGTNASDIVVLNQTNGKIIWNAHLSGDVLAKPVISDQKVIIKTIDGHLYAFNLHNGEKLWVVDHGAPNLVLKASSSPVIVDKMILVGFSDGMLDAIDLQTGDIVWQRSIAYARGASDVERMVDIDSDPIVKDNVVYLAGYQGYVGALSLKDGHFIWRKPASTYKNFIMDATTLYLTDSHDILWAFDKKNGDVIWKQPTLQARGLTEPVLLNNVLLVGDKGGYLHALSTQNGEFLTRKQFTGSIYTAPVVSENYAYVLANGQLNRFSVSS